MAIAIYVDDIFCINNNSELRQRLLEDLNKRFKMVNLGEANWILGMKILRAHNKIHIDQEKYLNDILTRFNMAECKTVVTPAIPENKIRTNEEPYKDKDKYLSLVGSLIYLSVVSRPDLLYTIGKVAQKMSNPNKFDWIAAKRIL